jgi:hypothetical protein
MITAMSSLVNYPSRFRNPFEPSFSYLSISKSLHYCFFFGQLSGFQSINLFSSSEALQCLCFPIMFNSAVSPMASMTLLSTFSASSSSMRFAVVLIFFNLSINTFLAFRIHKFYFLLFGQFN